LKLETLRIQATASSFSGRAPAGNSGISPAKFPVAREDIAKIAVARSIGGATAPPSLCYFAKLSGDS
jgi:hypothetical protein